MRKYIATAYLASEQRECFILFFGNKLDSKPLTVNISTCKYVFLWFSYLAICRPQRPMFHLKKVVRKIPVFSLYVSKKGDIQGSTLC